MKRSIKEIKTLITNDELPEPLLKELQADERKGVMQLLAQYDKRKQKRQALNDQYDQMSIFEREWMEKGFMQIAGIDEVGRGPLAGPVVASAVILPKNHKILGLNDSKKLSMKKREALYEIIMDQAVAVGIGAVEAMEIDRINIYQAAKKAMVQAVLQLSVKPDAMLIDAMKLPLCIPQRSLIKGDAKSVSIAASSIVAKVTRDRHMMELAKRYPNYQFDKHMGYPTKEHLQAIEKYGITPEHRRSFSPVANYLSRCEEE